MDVLWTCTTFIIRKKLDPIFNLGSVLKLKKNKLKYKSSRRKRIKIYPFEDIKHKKKLVCQKLPLLL